MAYLSCMDQSSTDRPDWNRLFMTAQVQDGAVEGSNVSAVETMVAMIAAARQFEAQMKMLSTAESNEKAAAQLLSVG